MLVTFRFEFMLRVEIYVVVVRSGLEWNTYWHFYQILPHLQLNEKQFNLDALCRLLEKAFQHKRLEIYKNG